MRGRCQAQLGILPERHQCPNDGEEFRTGNGRLVTYACTGHEPVLKSSIRQWVKIKDDELPAPQPDSCHDEAPSP